MVLTVASVILVSQRANKFLNHATHILVGYITLALIFFQALLGVFRNQISGYNPNTVTLDTPKDFHGPRSVHCKVLVFI